MKISELVNQINDELFLPSIQREFVWLNNRKEERIEKLFDSIMQRYPIGNIMIWNVKKQLGMDLPFTSYKFIENYSDEATNEEATLNGIKNPKLILDGQQRLTALLIGLKGSYSYRRYNQTKETKLYLNLFGDLEDDLNNSYGLKYEFRFLEPIEMNKEKGVSNKLWLNVGKVLDFDSEDAEKFKSSYKAEIEKSTDNDELKDYAYTTLGRLHSAICGTDINLVEVKDAAEDQEKNIDRVLNIFVRANDGGVKLEKSDLLLSFMESHRDLFHPRGARKEILGFVTTLNQEELQKPNYGFTKDDILKACLMLSGISVRYKIANFSRNNLEVISGNWENIKKAIKITVGLLAKYKFNKESITSKNALLPIAYYLYLNKKDSRIIDSSDENDVGLKNELMEWLVKALLSEYFGSSSDSTLERARKSIDEGNLPKVDSMTRDQILERVTKEKYKSKYSDLILKLITPTLHWSDYQQDHLHPQKYFNNEKFNELKLTEDEKKLFNNLRDSIGNIGLLFPDQNNSKSGQPLAEWLKNQVNMEKKLLIPNDFDLSFGNFINFVNYRQNFIVDHLSTFLGDSTI